MITVINITQKTGEEGQSPRAESLTVLILQSDTLNLPSFHIYPKNFLNKAFSGPEEVDVDIQRNSEFSNSYVLKADNMDDFKRVFTDQAVSYIGKHSGLAIEGNGSRLIFSRYTLLKPDELRSFLDDGLELFRMME